MKAIIKLTDKQIEIYNELRVRQLMAENRRLAKREQASHPLPRLSWQELCRINQREIQAITSGEHNVTDGSGIVHLCTNHFSV